MRMVQSTEPEKSKSSEISIAVIGFVCPEKTPIHGIDEWEIALRSQARRVVSAEPVKR